MSSTNLAHAQPSANETNGFLDLPEELLWLPFRFLGARDLMHLSSTCKLFNEILTSNRGRSLWMNRVKQQIHPYIAELHAREAGDSVAASWLWWRKLALLTENVSAMELEATIVSEPFQSSMRNAGRVGPGDHAIACTACIDCF